MRLRPRDFAAYSSVLVACFATFVLIELQPSYVSTPSTRRLSAARLLAVAGLLAAVVGAASFLLARMQLRCCPS